MYDFKNLPLTSIYCLKIFVNKGVKYCHEQVHALWKLTIGKQLGYSARSLPSQILGSTEILNGRGSHLLIYFELFFLLPITPVDDIPTERV